MRARLTALILMLALVAAGAAPAPALASSFPGNARDYVDNHIKYFVVGLVIAILILLLVAMRIQRRGGEKAKTELARSRGRRGHWDAKAIRREGGGLVDVFEGCSNFDKDRFIRKYKRKGYKAMYT